MKVGVIGCGAIGSVLCKFIDKSLKNSKLVAICDIDKEKVKRLQKSLKNKPIITNIDRVIKKSDIVVEAVSPS
ncbi:Gfo/Idh/MocA family oxidoreductase, partial [Candidatus Woesearchaeota archaeon]|nr:Gfo/Idh/MocA family oxidoreductase [Candidatus Woesearchaeota archaeon]